MADKAAHEALRDRLVGTGRWFKAVFPGICGSCGARYKVGDALRLPAPQALGWVAQCCAGDQR